jgi:hypothetical protein
MFQRGVISGGGNGRFFFTAWEVVANQVGGHPCPC